MAEILLKKTTAPAVDRFFPLFLERYPDVHTLHETPLCDLQKTLCPLGLSLQRAQQLKGLAKALVESFGGKIPSKREVLLELPGIGDYVAGAILSFACGMPEAIVDTNIARVIVRLFHIRPSHYEARRSPEVWDKARKLVGRNGRRSRRVNWAMLDLAAAVCKPKNPLHSECPLEKWCMFARQEHRGS
ncbi:MAG: hypothetical protein HY673_04770 [Chloroflexi bacterium]|nr:hypothetical protein [Chloroflexota bacterium]